MRQAFFDTEDTEEAPSSRSILSPMAALGGLGAQLCALRDKKHQPWITRMTRIDPNGLRDDWTTGLQDNGTTDHPSPTTAFRPLTTDF